MKTLATLMLVLYLGSMTTFAYAGPVSIDLVVRCDGGSCPLPPDGDDDCDGGSCPLPNNG